MFGLGYTFLGFFGFLVFVLLLGVIVIITLLLSGSQISWVQTLRDRFDKITDTMKDEDINSATDSPDKENTEEKEKDREKLSRLNQIPQKELDLRINRLMKKQLETEEHLKIIFDDINNLGSRIEQMQIEINNLIRKSLPEININQSGTLSQKPAMPNSFNASVKYTSTPNKSKRGFAVHKLTASADPRSIYKISFPGSDESTGIIEILPSENAISFLLNHPEDLLNPVAEVQNQRPEQPNGIITESPGKVSLQNEYYIVTEPIKIRYT
jgi:hypothetical protein